ncbi:MAG: glycoside hydrolase, family 43 [Myxococcaceae bacterium]|nr:glycoside hydrolase, family 43 [Myxococcaceae bacterium]
MRTFAFGLTLTLAAAGLLGACDASTTNDLPVEPDPLRSDGGAVVTGDADVTADADAAPLPPQPGLRAEYFEGYLDRMVDRVEPNVDHDWAAASPGTGIGADKFSARWSGTITAPTTGMYTMIVDSDDGMRLFVDGKLLVENWTGHFVTRNSASVQLTAGVPVAIRLDYFELDQAASVKLSWSSDAIAEEIIPTKYFLADKAPDLPSPKPPYANPVMAFDCPDPGVLATTEANGPNYYAVCTGGAFPIRQSRSLVTWKDSGQKILPAGKPPWAANGGRNWAPEIHKVGNGFVAYFTSVNGGDVLSIGAASSANVLGPYQNQTAPLVENAVGVIDATFFEDADGSRWLLYKIDGNSQGQATPIFLRKLAANGLSFAAGSAATEILRNQPATWEGGVVEAPWLVKRGAYYYLFYSGNVYDARYRTGVARATNLAGPYEKFGSPILANNAKWEGPGHGSVVTVGALDYFVYHAYPKGDLSQRQTLVDAIRYENGWPKISDGTPSTGPRPWPGEAR